MYDGKRRVCHLHKLKLNHSFHSPEFRIIGAIVISVYCKSLSAIDVVFFVLIRTHFCEFYLSATAVFGSFRLIKTLTDAKQNPQHLVSDKVAHSNSNIHWMGMKMVFLPIKRKLQLLFVWASTTIQSPLYPYQIPLSNVICVDSKVEKKRMLFIGASDEILFDFAFVQSFTMTKPNADCRVLTWDKKIFSNKNLHNSRKVEEPILFHAISEWKQYINAIWKV